MRVALSFSVSTFASMPSSVCRNKALQRCVNTIYSATCLHIFQPYPDFPQRRKQFCGFPVGYFEQWHVIRTGVGPIGPGAYAAAAYAAAAAAAATADSTVAKGDNAGQLVSPEVLLSTQGISTEHPGCTLGLHALTGQGEVGEAMSTAGIVGESAALRQPVGHDCALRGAACGEVPCGNDQAP